MTAQTGDMQFVNKKRPYSADLSDESAIYQNEKIRKIESPVVRLDLFDEHHQNRENAGSPTDNMWRPW